MLFVTDPSLLSLDLSFRVAVVWQHGRPAALVCVYAQDSDAFLLANTWTNALALHTVHGPIRVG